MLIEGVVQDVPTTPFVSCTGYFFDFACRSRTRLTTDCESRNIRAIAAGFMPVEWDALIRFAFPAGSSADTPELLLCRAWYLGAEAVFGVATVFTGFITPRRSASVVTSRSSVTSAASSRPLKVSERFFGSVTLGCSEGSLSGIDGVAPGVGFVAVIKLCE
jgi:hypothetical protein